MLEIRLLRADEIESLHRFLERSFGHGWGWFYRRRPALARVESMTNHSLVGLHKGEIVSHVGMYPLPIRSGPVHVMCGGVGSVSTDPDARGKGYMSQMLPAAVEHMTKQGWPVSVLWGDRQRYARFGWERAGALLHITVNRRSLVGFNKVPIEDADLSDPENAKRVAALHAQIPYRVERPHLADMLQASDMRLFIGPDGYVISTGSRAGDLTVIEVCSPTGKEANLIASAMERADANEAMVIMEPVTNSRTGRLLDVAAHWYLESRAMFRILNWPGLLRAITPVLAERAKVLAPFSVSITCYYSTDDTVETTATINWDGEQLTVKDGPGADKEIRVEARQLVRMIVGTPLVSYDGRDPLQHLFPVTLHIPRLDFV